MKHLYLIFTFLICSSISFGQNIKQVKIKGGEGIGKRELLIYTPHEYIDKSRKFEVVYVLDAQSREFFDAVHSTIAFQNHGLCPMIVVGIISQNRNMDFLPKNIHSETFQEQYGQLDGADNFSDFIEKTVMPYIDENYRTIPTNIGVGFSNGGTFINYTMLKKPGLFDVIFSIDANFNYDKGQLIELVENYTEDEISNTFYYTCQSPMNDDWVENSQRFNMHLAQKSSMTVKQDFFEAETHSTVYQQGIINAFKAYYGYQFFDSKNLIKYFKSLENTGEYILNKKELHRIAVVFKNFSMIEDAKSILISFQDQLTGDIKGNDVYALFETADLYYNLGFNDLATKYFLYCDNLLEENKHKYGTEMYNLGKDKIAEKLKVVEESE